jgi:hypothetical protein
VWFSEDLIRALRGTPLELHDLADGVGFSVAFRRAIRVGAVAGLGIEDVGVLGNIERSMTREDLEQGNTTLLDFCGQLLASEVRTDLEVSVDADGKLEATPYGLDRIDVYVDGRPVASRVVKGRKRADVRVGLSWSEIDVVGVSSQVVRQRRRLYPR